LAAWLVVEDEEDIRNIVKVMFQVWGHTPLEFKDGHEIWRWLDQFEAGDYSGALPDMVLMDIRMPGHKGNEIARRMRTIPKLNSVPVVLMTAFSLSEDERQGMLTDCGVDRIINKPLPDFFELKKILDEVCEKRRAQLSSAPAPGSAVAVSSAPAASSAPAVSDTPAASSTPAPTRTPAAPAGDQPAPDSPAPPASTTPPSGGTPTPAKPA
jgi:CheY-like chemotaxis protein